MRRFPSLRLELFATPVLIAVAGLFCLGGALVDGPGTLAQRGFCEPTFTVNARAQRSGSGFLLYGGGYPRRTYLFTAQHLFGVPASDMPTHVTAASCASPQTGHSYPAAAAIAIKGAHPMGPLESLKDVAVFPVLGRSPALSLADGDVTPGTPVWLLARVKSGAETGLLLHRALAGRADGYLVYRFDDQSIGLDQTSGAAVLNAAGQVVGLNVGYGRSVSGQLVGVADALSTLRGVVDGLR